MGWLVRDVSAQEFVSYFGEPSRDPLARFVLAPVPFPRAFVFAYREGESQPRARICGSQSIGKDLAVGFFSGDPEAFPAMNRHLEAWAIKAGASQMIGPMIYNTWFPYRARMFDDEQSRIGVDGLQGFSWEPNQNRGDERLWQESGYQMIESYASRGYSDLSGFHERLMPALDAALEDGFTVHAFPTLMETEESRGRLLDDLFQLTMESFKEAFLFQAIPREYFHQLYLAGFSELKDLSSSYLMRDRDGRAAAFSFAFPDRGYMVIKTLAVGSDYRGKRLSNAVMAASAETGVRQGLDKMIHALMRRGNLSEHFGGRSELLFEHCYGLFAKQLDSK